MIATKIHISKRLWLHASQAHATGASGTNRDVTSTVRARCVYGQAQNVEVSTPDLPHGDDPARLQRL